VSWIVTVAPGTAAPLASLTCPTIALVVSPCANAFTENHGRIKTMTPARISFEKVACVLGVESRDFTSAEVRAFVAGITINSGSDLLTRTSGIY
jgi:hypothetical protein